MIVSDETIIQPIMPIVANKHATSLSQFWSSYRIQVRVTWQSGDPSPTCGTGIVGAFGGTNHWCFRAPWAGCHSHGSKWGSFVNPPMAGYFSIYNHQNLTRNHTEPTELGLEDVFLSNIAMNLDEFGFISAILSPIPRQVSCCWQHVYTSKAWSLTWIDNIDTACLRHAKNNRKKGGSGLLSMGKWVKMIDFRYQKHPKTRSDWQ